jgi:dolichol-phosphate mannosyltransferase
MAQHEKAAHRIAGGDAQGTLRRQSFHQVVTDLHVEGFKILADMLAASSGRWKQAEVGYEFRQRHAGESKMDSAVALEFLGLLVSRLTGGVLSIRFVLFGMVGATGVVVQLLALRLFLLGLPDQFAVAQGLAVWVAMSTNFVMNNMITYRDRALRGGAAILQGLMSFYLICSVGALANVGLATWIYGTTASPELAGIAGAVVGALWNFVASSLVTWRGR